MTDYRPRLRAHLRVDEDKVVDELLDRELELEGTAAAVAALLDGARTWDELRAELTAAGHDGGDVDSALRGFILLHFVEGAGDEATARLVRVVRGEEQVPTSLLDGARFACQGSGMCCRSYALGPLSDADVARLEGLDLAGAFPALAPPYLEERDRGRYLRRVNERCVFLDSDERCGLHARFGVEAKPHFCRLYPLDAFGTVDGWRIVDRGSCASFGVAVRTGLPLYDDLPRVHALLDAAPALHHPIAQVDGRGWDYSLYLRFTRAALDLVARELAGAVDTLAAIARWLDALARAVAWCPLEPGQPEDTFARVLEMDGAFWYRPPRQDAARRGLVLVLELIEAAAATVTAALDAGAAGASASQMRDFRAAADRLLATLRARDHVADPPALALADDVEDVLRTSMKQQLFGRHVLAEGHAGGGLVRIGLVQLFALAVARERAGARPLTAADLSRGHALALRAFQTNVLDELLGDNDEYWRELIDGLWLACRLAAAPA